MSSTERNAGWFGVEWRHLAALQAVAEAGSFAGAARLLGYTQPAISQQIAALEHRIGGTLVDRSKVGEVRLTEAGRRLVSHSVAIAGRLETAHDDVKAALEGKSAVLRLGVLPSVGANLLAPVLRSFVDEWVGIRVVLSETWSDKELLKSLARGEVDMAFAIMPIDPGPFLARVVARDEYVLVCSRDSDLAQRGEPISLLHLGDVPLLFLHYQLQIEALLRSHGVEPHVSFRSDDNQTLMAFVAEGLGATIVPRLALSRFDPRLTELRVVEQLPSREIALVWSSERGLTTPAEAFINMVVDRDRGASPERGG